MNVSVLVNAFTGGELSPLLAARQDTPNYATGAKRIENAIPMVTGGIRKRPGTWYLRNTTGNKPVILIDWLLTDGTSCLVEISEQSNRLQALVSSEGLEPGVALFPAEWTGVDLAKVRHAVGKGIVDGAPLYAPRFVTMSQKIYEYSDDGVGWTQGRLGGVTRTWFACVYGDGRFVAITGDVCIYSDDGVKWTRASLPEGLPWYGLTYGGGRFVAVASGSNVCIYSDDGGATWTKKSTLPVSGYWQPLAYGVVGNDGRFVTLRSGSTDCAYSDDGETWIGGDALPMSAPWHTLAWGGGLFVALAYGSNDFVYSEDGITWTKGDLPVSGTWETLAYGVVNGVGRFVALGYLGSGTAGSDVCIYSEDGVNWMQATDPLPVIGHWYALAWGAGRFVALGRKDGNRIYSADGVHWTQGEPLPAGGDDWKALACGDTLHPSPPITTADYMLFTSEDYPEIACLTIEIQNTTVPPSIAVDVSPFPISSGLAQTAPSNVKDIAFYAGRLALGGLMASDGSPTRIMLSRAPDSLSGKYRYNDFTAGALAGDAIVIDENDMAGSSVEWVFAGRRFLAATGRASWMDTGDVPTPATFDMGIVEYAGAAFRKPVASKEVIVYTGRDGKRLRALVWQYSNNSGGYADVDIGVVAQHLFSSGIVSYAVMDYPFPTIWLVNGAGELISCTINMQAGITAFARHSLGNLNPTPENPFYAYAESVEVARLKDSDRLYVVVRRGNVATGVETRSIEWLELEDLVTADYTESHYVDSGVRVEFPGEEGGDTISGLGRLAGQTVSVFADGALQGSYPVPQNGTITLSAPVKKAHVGLPITTRLSLNTAQIPANGSSFGKKRRIEKIILNLYKSIGGMVGTTEQNGEVVITQRFDQYAYGAPVIPFTGNIELFVSGNIDVDGALFITHTQPTPFTALAVVERIAIMEG